MRISNILRSLGLLSVVALALSACGTDQNGSGEPVSGGTFTAAVSEEVGSIIPMSAIQPSERQIVNYAYDSLIYADSDGKFEPWLAESWEIDGSTAIFHLKDGITCADGAAFDAETAAENINFHADPKNESLHHGSRIANGVKATGEGLKLEVTAPSADPFLVENTGLVEMVCSAGLEDPKSLEQSSNGTGLFTLVDVRAGEYIFEKRDDYTWGPDGMTADTEGVPDRLEIRVITDESTRANLILSEELNGARVSGADRERVEATGLHYTATVNPVGQMLFNERDDRPTHDPLVREALALAFDHDAAAQVITDGNPVEFNSIVTKSPFLCVREDAPPWTIPSSDPARAADLLDKAGWVLGSDGDRHKDGKPLKLTFIYDATSPTHAAAAELVREMWAEVGIRTELQANDSAAWSESLYETYDWDTGWVQTNAGTPALLNNFFDGRTPEDGGVNFMFVDNPDYAKLVEQAMQAPPEKTCGYWQEAEKALVERFDVLPLTNNERPTFMSGAEFEETDYIEPTSIRMTE